MRTGIDISSALAARGSGIAAYVRALMKYAPPLAPDDEFVFCVRAGRGGAPQNRDLPPNCSVKVIREPLNVLFPGSLDVFHGPDARIPAYGKPALVATVHDLFSLVSDSFADAKFRKKKIARYRDIAERADVIITPSGHTKKDVVERLGAPPERVRVVHMGGADFGRPEKNSEAGADSVREKYGLPGRYILFVGNVSARKNTAALVRAFKRLERSGSAGGCALVIAGRDGIGAEEAHQEAASQPEGAVKILGYDEGAELGLLYRGARVFTLPSLYEGFGIPVVEAFKAGVPVVTSDVSSLPEVAGGAALLVDPRDEDALADALGKTISDESLRGELVKKGLERAKDFSWKSTAEKTLAIYREAYKMKLEKQ